MTTEVAERPSHRAYVNHSPADIERGLQTLAICGTPKRASEQSGIPESTLRDWVSHKHRDRYLAIREQVMPQIHAEIATQSEDLARKWAQLEEDGLDDLKENWDELKPAEKSSALRNATVSRGISIDKASLLRGRPTSIVHHNVDEDIRALVALGVMQTIDGTAEEITDAEQDGPLAT